MYENSVYEMPLLAPLQPLLHRVALHHRVDREVLAHVAEKLHEVERAEPLGVVDHERAVGRRVEVEVAPELRADAAEVAVEHLAREQLALLLLAARVADEPGAAADDGDGPVPRALEPHEVDDLQQAAGVEAAAVGSKPM
jgi:hypothetical protein